MADPEAWRKLLQRHEGHEIDLRLTRKRKTRSLSANAYYWGVVVALLAEHCGYEPEEAHQALKMRFLLKIGNDMISTLPTVRSTADLDTVEFAAYLDQCIRLCAEMGIVVPDPGAAE